VRPATVGEESRSAVFFRAAPFIRLVQVHCPRMGSSPPCPNKAPRAGSSSPPRRCAGSSRNSSPATVPTTGPWREASRRRSPRCSPSCARAKPGSSSTRRPKPPTSRQPAICRHVRSHRVASTDFEIPSGLPFSGEVAPQRRSRCDGTRLGLASADGAFESPRPGPGRALPGSLPSRQPQDRPCPPSFRASSQSASRSGVRFEAAHVSTGLAWREPTEPSAKPRHRSPAARADDRKPNCLPLP
jgi:hypothetical protein